MYFEGREEKLKNDNMYNKKNSYICMWYHHQYQFIFLSIFH